MHRLPVYDRQLRPPRPPFHRSPDDCGYRRLYLGLAAHGEPGHGGAGMYTVARIGTASIMRLRPTESHEMIRRRSNWPKGALLRREFAT
jgi:hypothetical protein